MAGRIARRAAVAAMVAAEAARAAAGPQRCALCLRPLGRRVEWHHPVPKSEGGRDTVPLHPICHRAVHAYCTNAELARDYADMAALRRREDMARFLRWVADKPPDFHAPTRRVRGGD